MPPIDNAPPAEPDNAPDGVNMPGNHPNPVPYAPPVGVPTVKAIYYSPSITGVRRFENIPYVGTGRRILSLRSVMKGYPAVSIKSTIVNLVTGGQGENPRKVNVFRIFTRRDPAFLANPSLWALTGGVEWEGDLCIVRAGSQRGKDYVSITSAKEVQMAINAVILFLEYTHRYNRMPTLLNFAEYGMDLPFVNANDLHGHYVWNVAGVPGLLPVHAPGPNIVPPPYAPPPVVAAPVAPPPAVAAPVAPPPAVAAPVAPPPIAAPPAPAPPPFPPPAPHQRHTRSRSPSRSRSGSATPVPLNRRSARLGARPSAQGRSA